MAVVLIRRERAPQLRPQRTTYVDWRLFRSQRTGWIVQLSYG